MISEKHHKYTTKNEEHILTIKPWSRFCYQTNTCPELPRGPFPFSLLTLPLQAMCESWHLLGLPPSQVLSAALVKAPRSDCEVFGVWTDGAEWGLGSMRCCLDLFWTTNTRFTALHMVFVFFCFDVKEVFLSCKLTTSLRGSTWM